MHTINKKLPLMPKAIAVWLIENRRLTFKQIADFCGLHELEVKNIANEESSEHIQALDPIINMQLTIEEILRCEGDASQHLRLLEFQEPVISKKVKKQTKYTPIARRQDKPDAICWIIKNYPDLSDKEIAKLVGTTKTTIESIRTKAHWNIKNMKPRDPVLLGICTQMELDAIAEKLNN